MSKIKSLLPPRKRDWIKGKAQVGLFMRGPDGDVIEFVANEATPEQHKAALIAFATMIGDADSVERLTEALRDRETENKKGGPEEPPVH